MKSIEAAWLCWEKLLEETEACAADVIVFLVSDERINTETIANLNRLKGYGFVNRFIIVSDDSAAKETLDNSHIDRCSFYVCDTSCIDQIIKLYSVYPFTNRLIINDTRGYFDADPYCLEGFNGITREDILRRGFLNLELNEKKESNRKAGKKINYKRIDWSFDEMSNKNAKCEGYIDLLDSLILEGIITTETRIVICAVTVTAKAIIEHLKGYNIVAVVDNDPCGKTVEGIKVQDLDEYFDAVNAERMVIVASRHYKQLCEQLFCYGYEFGKNVFAVHDQYIYDCKDVERKNILREAEEGKKIYEHLRCRYPENKFLIEAYQGTGDLFLAWCYLMDEGKDQSDFVYVTGYESCKRLAATLGISYECMERERVISLITYLRAEASDEKKYILINTNFRQLLAVRLAVYKGLDFNSYIQRTLFKVKHRTKPRGFNQRSSSLLFQKCGLREGKTVLLSPYSNSDIGVGMDIWCSISDFLRRIGYDICTNVFGNEKPVPETVGVSVPYDMLLDFVKNAGVFIGVRSGLCDIITSVNAHMIVLYRDFQMPSGGSFFGFFGLENMGLRNKNILEIAVDDTESTLSRTRDYFEKKGLV